MLTELKLLLKELCIPKSNNPVYNHKHYCCHWVVLVSNFLAEFVLPPVFISLVLSIAFVQVTENKEIKIL